MKILFQGDSITDCGRNRSDVHNLGDGYPLLVGAKFLLQGNECLNTGISGNRINDVYARIKADIINLQPDVMSILIGVNDVWHEIEWQNGVDDEEFFFLYDRLLTKVKEALPNLRLLLLEPFVLEHTATCATPEQPNRFALFQNGVAAKAVLVKQLAEKHGCTLVPLQQALRDAAGRLGVAAITHDGVHPTYAGHQVIADAWIKAFEE